MRLPRGVARFNPRLARAGEATHHQRWTFHFPACFNPRLARAGEATRCPQNSKPSPSCFNPRLARAGEATCAGGGPGGPIWFQSAPRPCGRGDWFILTRNRRRVRFNPRLARAGEATRENKIEGQPRHRFNPRLARAGEATYVS